MPTCRAVVVGTDGAATTPADVHRPAEHRGAGHATADRATKDRAAGVVADSAAELRDRRGGAAVRGRRADRPHDLTMVRPLDPGPPIAPDLDEALEAAVLGAGRRYTRGEVADAAGLQIEEGMRLLRSLGFPEVPADAVLFNDRDLDAAKLLASLTDAGLVDPDVREAVARATAQSMSRLAEWQVGMLERLMESSGAPSNPEQTLQVAREVLPVLEELQSYVWRRHLAAAVVRMLVPPAADGRECLVVGVADVIGFTHATRRRSTAELAGMIERFGSSTTEVTAEGRGRIVKTIGDEVLFVAHTVGDGAAIALALQDRVRTEPALPPLRIGLAVGSVLVRDGDVHGEVVNTAAHLTGHARPDTVLVDREAAEALAVDARFALRPLRPVALPDDRRLYPWVLERAT